MNGTNCCSGGPERPRSWQASLPWRVAGLALVVLVEVVLIVWIKTSTWQQLRDLREEIAAMKVESFHLGIQLRSGLDRLNGALLRFQLSKADPDGRETFHAEARRLGQLIAQVRPHLRTAEERTLVEQAEKALQAYLEEAQPLLERSLRAVRRDSAEQVYVEIERISAVLRPLCRQLVDVQQETWRQFVLGSDNTLHRLRASSQVSLLALLVFGLSLLVLTYVVAVAPLRHRLTETEAVVGRQEKLASLGTLAAGVAHEVRNPLAAIKFRLFSLKQSLPQDFRHNEDVLVIGQEINRLERIVKDFLQFARPAEPTLARIPAEQVMHAVQSLLHQELEKAAIALKLQPAQNIWIHADKQQIEQVLINLVQNAADSIGRNGTISLRVKQGAARLNGRSRAAVILEVADTGGGIPTEVQKRLFDPFFSTKEAGTGLGLSIAERIVEKHGGVLQYQTQLNRGTTFQIVLPCPPDHASQNTPH
jgi:signal transduction histidine kinase